MWRGSPPPIVQFWVWCLGISFWTNRKRQCAFHWYRRKYKTTALGSHRQKTKRKKKQRLARLDWDVNTGYRSPAGWIGTSTRPHHYTPPPKHHSRKRRAQITARAHRKHPSRHRAFDEARCWNKSRKGADVTTSRRSPPCRALRRSAAATNTKTSWRSENTEFEQLSTRGGLATSAAGLLISRARGPRHARHQAHASNPLWRYRQEGEPICSTPSSEPTPNRRWRPNSIHCFPLPEAVAIEPADQGCRSRHRRCCIALGGSNHVEATRRYALQAKSTPRCCCHKRHLSTLSRTALPIASMSAMVRCK
jgi:hypothetical protein